MTPMMTRHRLLGEHRVWLSTPKFFGKRYVPAQTLVSCPVLSVQRWGQMQLDFRGAEAEFYSLSLVHWENERQGWEAGMGG